MAHKLSEQLEQKKVIPSSKNANNLEKIAIVFFCFGIISLFTARIFDTETKQIFRGKAGIFFYSSLTAQQADEQDESNSIATIGPINVQKYKEVYEIDVATGLPQDTWVFVEGEVLDSEKNYLFSFGKELWRETGYDDGAWDESDSRYSMKITLSGPGQYYLNLKTEGSYNPDALQVTITKELGSSIPHMVFAIFAILIGIILNEIVNKTLINFVLILIWISIPIAFLYAIYWDIFD